MAREISVETGAGDKPMVTQSGGSGEEPQRQNRQSRPKPVNPDYRVRDMIYLQITTQELRILGLSSGAGSTALAFAGYFAKEAYSNAWPSPLILATIGFTAITIFVYSTFFGLIRSIRRQSKLDGLGIYGE